MTTLILAAVAAFVLWRLWLVLGYRTGNEPPPGNSFPRVLPRDLAGASQGSNVTVLPGAAPVPVQQPALVDPARWQAYAQPNSALWEGLDAIAARDPGFDPKSFLQGSRVAYEMIVKAFAESDRKTLKGLCSAEVYNDFAHNLDLRASAGEVNSLTFISLDKQTITHAQMQGNIAQLTLEIAAQMISVTRDKAGTVVAGSADAVHYAHDTWTYARDVTARDLNWRLVATGPLN